MATRNQNSKSAIKNLDLRRGRITSSVDLAFGCSDTIALAIDQTR